MLRRWTVLINYFEKEAKIEESAKVIYESLIDPSAELYLKFLYFILLKFTTINEKLQSVTPIFSADRAPMADLYYDTLSLYMHQSHLMNNKLIDIDPENKEYMKEPKHINVGIDCLRLLNKSDSKITEDQKKEFFEVSQRFLIKACVDLKKRCNDFVDDHIKLRHILHPSNALNKSFHKNDESNLNALFKAFSPFVNSQYNQTKISEQWKLLCQTDFTEDIRNEKKIDIFWDKIANYRNANNENCFQELGDFAMLTLLLPNSNASVERLWSKYNLEKTKFRNRLDFVTMRGVLLGAQLSSHIRK